MKRKNMLWLHEHKNVWRVAILALLLVAILGPWWFDRIVVPSKYPCSNPTIRLEGDYCGIPMPGIWILWGLGARSIELLVELVTGAVASSGSGDSFSLILFYDLLVFLLVLPFFSTVLLFLRKDRRRQQVFHLAAWGLAASASLLMSIEISRLTWLWALWGNGLYIGVAASAVILEVLLFIFPKDRLSPPNPIHIS
jgi:hypothetical protein